ncbi:baseplate protein [Pseudomonas monteilii]|jgi:hypothetical protein|nr:MULTISPECIES: GPW/gp25 family protein [Pseudomonas]AVH35428.1 baseplate protein [Pseudomonas monteilii]MDT3716040.1 GPW/gp25 family protein [Pseudomonas soli]MDT3732876.1 GPW/gp25 family protein [Pseudomonas soli]
MTTPISLSNITAVHWQPALGTAGAVVEGLRDIDQAIRIILTTPKGSDPHRPTFGSDVHQYIDWPVNRVVPHLVREAVDAIRIWEPRVDVVEVTPTIEGAQARLKITWRVANGVPQLTEVSYARAV